MVERGGFSTEEDEEEEELQSFIWDWCELSVCFFGIVLLEHPHESAP
jgi:hypothetical protein